MADDTPASTGNGAPGPRRTVLSAFETNNDYFTRIGAICAEWAAFEARLDQTIQLLSGMEPAVAAAITSQINGPVPRMRVILSLLEVKGASQAVRDKLVAYMNKTHGIADQRNRVVHDPWLYEWTTDNVQQRVSGRIGKTFKHEYKNVSLQELIDLRTAINIHCVAYEGIFVAITDEMPRPSP